MDTETPQADQVAQALRRYLSQRLGTEVSFAEEPQDIPHGWSTYTYTFQLQGDGLSKEWLRPLILRRFARADQGPQAEREGAVQRFADRVRGYFRSRQ